jgi:hypothetical protein
MFSCILSGTDTHILFFGYLAYLISFLQFSGPFRQFSLLHSKKCLLKNIILLVPKIKQKKRKQKQHQNIMKQPNVIRRLIFLFFSFIFPFFLFLFFYGKASNKKTNLEENPTPTEGIVSKKRKNLEENPTSTKGIITYIANKCT